LKEKKLSLIFSFTNKIFTLIVHVWEPTEKFGLSSLFNSSVVRWLSFN